MKYIPAFSTMTQSQVENAGFLFLHAFSVQADMKKALPRILRRRACLFREEIVSFLLGHEATCMTNVTIRMTKRMPTPYMMGEMSLALPVSSLRITQASMPNIMPLAIE